MNKWTFKECFTIDIRRRLPDPGFGDYLRHLFFSADYTAVLLYRLSRYFTYRKFAPFNRGIRYLPNFLYRLNVMICGADIDRSADIAEGFMIGHSPGVVIGARVSAGKNLTVFSGVTLGARERVIDPEEKRTAHRFPVIGDNVTVYTGAKILGPVNIGDNAVVGANAVVLDDVPAGRTVVGVPGRLLPERKGGSEEE
jgi:serine O-acetyltransferase